MTLTDPIFELLAYEVALIFAIIAGLLLFKSVKASRKLNTDTAKAVKQIKQNRSQREQAIRSVLAEKYGLDGEALNTETHNFIERETAIYKSLLNLFAEQDGKALVSIPQQLEKAIDAGLTIVPQLDQITALRATISSAARPRH